MTNEEAKLWFPERKPSEKEEALRQWKLEATRRAKEILVTGDALMKAWANPPKEDKK